MQKIKIKLADPSRRFYSPVHASYISGDQVAEVPKVPYWLRLVRDGTFVRVSDDDLEAAQAGEPVNRTKRQEPGEAYRPPEQPEGESGDASESDDELERLTAPDAPKRRKGRKGRKGKDSEPTQAATSEPASIESYGDLDFLKGGE